MEMNRECYEKAEEGHLTQLGHEDGRKKMLRLLEKLIHSGCVRIILWGQKRNRELFSGEKIYKVTKDHLKIHGPVNSDTELKGQRKGNK